MRARNVLLLALGVCLILQSSAIYKPPQKPIYFSALAEPLPPISLAGYKPTTVWEAADAVEYNYGIPKNVLKAMIMWESGGKLTAYNKNKDKSVDQGPMQLNSKCLMYFAKRYNGGTSIDPCSLDSVRIGGAILADYYRLYGSWRTAIQHYNYRAKGYADSVFKCYLKLQGLD